MPQCSCLTDSSLSASLQEVEPVLKTLADANRLKLVCLLSKHEHCVCELMELTGLAQNLVSHHLAVLKKAQLVESRRQGTNIYYTIHAQSVGRVMKTLQHVLNI